MENRPEQVFYIKYDLNNGYVLGQLTENGYSKLSDDDKKNYRQVIVDQSHLNGWGKYWPTVRYVNGALSYPDNWPKDQSEQISDLSKQVHSANQSVSALQTQLTNATKKIKELGQLDMQLQMQLAKANVKPSATKQNGGNK